jgi:UTP-glucose-1-phosphate uridylyltransferase
MMQRGKKVLAYKINTVRHDIGNPQGWLQANIYYALCNSQNSLAIKSYLQKFIP